MNRQGAVYRGMDIVPQGAGFIVEKNGKQINRLVLYTEAAAIDWVDAFKEAERELQESGQ